MALPSVRHEYRIARVDADRGEDAEHTVVLARHPSETLEHVTLRVLAWCLLLREGLVFGPGLSDGDASDLEARDPTGRMACWVECGAVDAAKLRKIVQQNPDAEVHVVFAGEKRRAELLAGLEESGRVLKGASRVTTWTFDADLVAALASQDSRRQKWSVTMAGGHLYVERDGEHLDGAIEERGLPETPR